MIREMFAAIARAYKGTGLYTSTANLQASLEWLDLSYGKTITRNSDTQVTIVSAHLRTYFKSGRRVRIISASASADGYVSSDSTLSGSDTVVPVTMDGGTVPASPSKVLAFSAASVKNPAFKVMGAGGGLDADKVDGLDAAQLGSQRNVLINGRFDEFSRVKKL